MAKKKSNTRGRSRNVSTSAVKNAGAASKNSNNPGRANSKNGVAQNRPAPSSNNQIRNIVLAILAILVIAVVAAVIFVFTRSDSSNSANSSSSNSGLIQSGSQSGDLLANVQPIILSSEGVGVRNEEAPDITLYFDYSCHACAQIDDLVFDLILDDIEDGKYNLLLQPVNTVNMAYHPIATKAALLVAQYEPENFVEFHSLLLGYFWTAYQAGDGSVVTYSEPSLEAVQDLADQAGVSQEIIDLFDSVGALEYLNASTTSWDDDTEAGIIEGRDNNATPEVVANNVSIRFSGSSATDIHENFLESLRDAGLDV